MSYFSNLILWCEHYPGRTDQTMAHWSPGLVQGWKGDIELFFCLCHIAIENKCQVQVLMKTQAPAKSQNCTHLCNLVGSLGSGAFQGLL